MAACMVLAHLMVRYVQANCAEAELQPKSDADTGKKSVPLRMVQATRMHCDSAFSSRNCNFEMESSDPIHQARLCSQEPSFTQADLLDKKNPDCSWRSRWEKSRTLGWEDPPVRDELPRSAQNGGMT